MNCDASSEGVLKPLLFQLEQNDISECENPEKVAYKIDCMVCSMQFNEAKEFCQHMVLEHRIVIADSKLIAYLKGYAEYWKKRFMEQAYTDICSPIVISGPQADDDKQETTGVNIDAGTGDQEKFYLLSGAIDEDRLLREKLKRKRLEVVLKQFEKERVDDSFNRPCLFCKKQFTGNRSPLFKHLAEDHNLCVGSPDNIVFVEEFLDLLEEKINHNFQCLLCEKIFKDCITLKEHMRKKQHKKINPQNAEFDKFYLINYLELGKNWETIQAEDDSEICDDPDESSEELWGDWNYKEFCSVCLFCNCMSPDGDVILLHMKEAHGFNLCKIKKLKNLSYYQQVKLVNYIRRQVYHLCCFNCLRQFQKHDDLIEHLMADKHIDFIPDISMWDQPQYYFPTYENDYLLCFLDNYDNLERCEEKAIAGTNLAAAGDSHVVSEEINIPTDSILWNECLRCQLLTL